MVRALLTRVVSPGVAAASHMAWYIGYYASGGAVTREDERAPDRRA